MSITKEINTKFIESIKEKIPNEANMAKVIMDILSIGKEATYRRLRGDVSFSFDEVIILSRKLSISIDAFAGTHSPNEVLFELIPVSYQDMKDVDYVTTQQFNDALNFMKDDIESELAYASNMFPQFIFSRYYNLAKFHAYKWGYQNKISTTVVPFHEMDYPDDFYELNLRNVEEMTKLKKTCYILDDRVFHAMVNDVKYFQSINLIQGKDVKKIRTQLLDMLDDFEKIIETGRFKTGNKVEIYLSNMNFETTYCYLKGNSFNLSMIGVFGLNYVTSLDRRTLEYMKEWIHILKTSSTLISESGQIQIAQFINAQRKVFSDM